MFQDLITKKMIDSGRVEHRFYILNEGGQLAYPTIVSKNKAEDLVLWHRRLGHPSFSLLNYMFPSFVLIFLVRLVNLESIIEFLSLLVIIKVITLIQTNV